jgi:hypothetical protein
MLMLRMLLCVPMIVSYEAHHKKMGQWAEQHQSNIHNLTYGDIKQIDSCQSRDGDKTACDHHPDMCFFHQ